MTCNFGMSREPAKGRRPFKYIDFRKANEVTMTRMADMGIRLREPTLAVGDCYTGLSRGTTLGTHGQIEADELQDMMAGGQELAELGGSLGGTV